MLKLKKELPQNLFLLKKKSTKQQGVEKTFKFSF